MEKVVEECNISREKIKILKEKPHFYFYYEFPWRIFFDLNKKRRKGFVDLESIPYSEISIYLSENGIFNRNERLILIEIIDEMDDAFLKYYRDQFEQKEKKDLENEENSRNQYENSQYLENKNAVKNRINNRNRITSR